MQIPDPLVYSSLPVLGGAAVWIGRQFVRSVARDREPEPDQNPGASAPVMSLRDYRNFSQLLKEDLNGRYMLASEARTRFEAIERKIDELKEFIRAHGAQGLH